MGKLKSKLNYYKEKGCNLNANEVKKILDKLEETESDLYEANNRINDLLDIVKDKDKIIKLMAEDLNDFYDDNAIEYRKRTIEDTIKKFEERCK